MVDEHALTKYYNVETLVLDKCNVELAVLGEAPGTIGVDPVQETKAADDRAAKTLTLTGYEGQVAISGRGHIDIRAKETSISGTLADGHIASENLDLKCEAPAETIDGVKAAVPPLAVGIGIDLLGVAIFTGFYVMLFAVVSNIFHFDPLHYLGLEVILGAGTYFGYTGHVAAPTLLALIAIGAGMFARGAKVEGEKNLGDYVAWWDLVKIGIFFAIMLTGRMLRDYIDSYKRGGWAGLRNKMRR